MNRIVKLSILVVVMIVLDYITKMYIQNYMTLGESIPVVDGLFNITFVKNTGVAFGMGADLHSNIRRPLFLFIPVLACIWLVWLIWKSRKGSLLDSIAYSLILAGAVGNLIDRFTIGYVVDFLDFFYKSSHFPAFNIADSCITVAAFLLIINFIIIARKHKLGGVKTEA